MPTPSRREKLVAWEVLSTSLKSQLTEIPQMADDQAALERLVAQAQELEVQQGRRLADLREINARRRELEKDGDVLRERMAAGLRHKLGVDNKRLLEFGLKPKPEQRRKAQTAEQKKQAALARLKKRMAELTGAPAATP
jgi:hypothetical protein